MVSVKDDIRKKTTGYVKVKPYDGNEWSLFTGEAPNFKATGNQRIVLPVNSPILDNYTENQRARRFRNVKRNISAKAAPHAKISFYQNYINIIKSGLIDAIRHMKQLDYTIVFFVIALSVCGIFAVHSATHSFGRSRYDIMQIGMTLVGLCSMIVLSLFDFEKYVKTYKLIYIFNIILLTVTIFFGVGPDGVGTDTNKNWLRLGPVGIQPSEFAKIIFIFTFAIHLSKVRDSINSIKNIASVCLHGLLIIGLVLLQKDLGMAIVYLVIFSGMLFCAKISWKYIIPTFSIVVLSAPFIWNHLDNYQQKRILVGFNPELDPEYFGYQVIRSKIAIGAGGLTGSGYMQGVVSQSDSFPAKQTDMIFAVICEEFGLIGACAVLVLYCLLLYRIFSLCTKFQNSYEYLFCCGICTMLIFQIIENIGMCLGFMPVVGITLPFISYGGSSVLSLYFAFGILISMSKNRQKI